MCKKRFNAALSRGPMGPFRVREVVYVCGRRCKRQGSLVTRRDPDLAELIPPKSTVGYDVMVYIQTS